MVEKVRNSLAEAAERSVAAVEMERAAATRQSQTTRHLVVQSGSGRSRTVNSGAKADATRPSAHPGVLGNISATSQLQSASSS